MKNRPQNQGEKPKPLNGKISRRTGAYKNITFITDNRKKAPVTETRRVCRRGKRKGRERDMKRETEEAETMRTLNETDKQKKKKQKTKTDRG